MTLSPAAMLTPRPQFSVQQMGCQQRPCLRKQITPARCQVRGRARSHCLPPPLPKELEEAYQDAAGNVLVAICRHSWQPVAQQLETEVLTGVFPHRSLLYVMGVLTSNRTSRPPVTSCPRLPSASRIAWRGWGRARERSGRGLGGEACLWQRASCWRAPP